MIKQSISVQHNFQPPPLCLHTQKHPGRNVSLFPVRLNFITAVVKLAKRNTNTPSDFWSIFQTIRVYIRTHDCLLLFGYETRFKPHDTLFGAVSCKQWWYVWLYQHSLISRTIVWWWCRTVGSAARKRFTTLNKERTTEPGLPLIYNNGARNVNILAIPEAISDRFY